MASVPETHWVPDDMATKCCICRAEFNLVRRRHHCRTCGRVVCDDCSGNRIGGDRVCTSCWHRLGRKFSGLELPGVDDTAPSPRTPQSSHGRLRSALAALLQEERFNRKFVLADGRSVSYAIAGAPDGLPVFLFLGLDAHRHAAAHFEDSAKRRGIRLICFDRPGRGGSDPIPPVSPVNVGDGEKDAHQVACTATEEAVVDVVKQMCAKLRIDKAGLLGHSVGAVYALRCARDQGLKDILDGTTTCLVAPWVPLAAKDANVLLQGISSTGLKGTLGRLAADIAIKQTTDLLVWRGQTTASEIEKGYMEAPYSQELMWHISDVKQNKEAVSTTEALIALENDGEDEAKRRCSAVLLPVRVWHGAADQVVPVKAVHWMEEVMPSCTCSVKAGGTHAMVYDKGEMELVFTALQKSVSEARAKDRFTARRIGSQLSYVASSVFASGDGQHSASRASSTASASVEKGKTSKEDSQGAGEAETLTKKEGGHGSSSQPSKDTANSTSGKDDATPDDSGNLRDRVVKAISSAAGRDTSEGGSGHGRAGSGASPHGSAHGSSQGLESGHGTGSGHGAGSGHGLGLSLGGAMFSIPLSGGEGSGGGRGINQRKGSSASASGSLMGISGGGSWHSNPGINSSLHGSAIPENGEMDWGSEHAGGSASIVSAGVLSDVGKQVTRAFSDAFGGSDHGSTTSASGGKHAGVGDYSHNLVSEEVSDAGGADTGGRVANEADGGGFLGQVDRMISSLTISKNNSCGSGLGSAGGSGHGSVGESLVGTAAGGSAHGSIGGGSNAGGMWRPTPLAPWSKQSQSGDDPGSTSRYVGDGHDDDGVMEGLKRGVERALSAVGVAAPSPSGNSSAHGFGGSSAHGIGSSSMHDLTSSRHSSVAGTGRTLGSGMTPGYDAAMANWPAGKIVGEPAWEEWSTEKKLVAHLITAFCLALIIATW